MKYTIFRKKFFNKRKRAFTLAEVLLTLAVIGIVATLTVPQLLANTENAHMVAKLRKAQSAFQQAVKISMAQNTTTDLSSSRIFEDTAPVNAWTFFKPYLNVVKECGTAVGQGCLPKDVTYKFVNGENHGIFDNYTVFYKAVLADGTAVILQNLPGNCDEDFSRYGTGPLKTVCGYFGIDLNGDSPPNTHGFDFFLFYILKDGVVFPMGTPDDINYGCSTTGTRNATDGFAGYGGGCTYKALEQGKIDW